MTTLWLRSRNDVPHCLSRAWPGKTACGRALFGAQRITELQALVWLDDARCPTCFPQHVHIQRRAAA